MSPADVLERVQKKGRQDIVYQPENRTQLAANVEAAILVDAPAGSYVNFGGVLSEIVSKSLPHAHMVDHPDLPAPPVQQIVPLDQVAILSRAELAVRFVRLTNSGMRPMPVPVAIIDILLKKRHHAAPVVKGLVSHPAVAPDGTILALDGLDGRTALFLCGAGAQVPQAYDQAQAREALERLRHFLCEFEFATALDVYVAIAALITGVQRRVLDTAPGFAILAPGQSSGKTTLARFVHLILTGQDMSVSTFAEGDESETQKRLLAMLMRGPAMVCLDNMTDGSTFRSPSIAAAMTGPVLSQRVLGVSREVECPTNVLFVLTGNNLGLGPDELTRWLPCRLNSKEIRPERRKFRNSDVVAYVLGVRSQVLADIVGIVAGYFASGAAIAPATRFPHWDRMVRQPMLWAGAGDMADVFKANAESSEDLLAHQALLGVLHEIFGNKEFLAIDVTRAVTGFGSYSDDDDGTGKRAPGQATSDERLRSALGGLRAKDPTSEQSVGRVLRAAKERRAKLDDDGVRTARLVSRVRGGMNVWRLDVIDERG